MNLTANLYAVILLDEQLLVRYLFLTEKNTASRRYTFTKNKTRRVGVRCGNDPGSKQEAVCPPANFWKY